MRPAVGTWCVDCLARGHRCQSQIFIGMSAVCLPCADGEPCSFERVAAQKKTAVEEDEWGEPMPGPVKSVPVALRPTLTPEQLVAKIKDGQAKARAEGKHVGRPRPEIDPATVAELRAGGFSWRAIAKRLGAGRRTVERLYKVWQNEAPKESTVYQAITPELEGEIIAAFKGGMTTTAISRKFKVGYYVADGIIKRPVQPADLKPVPPDVDDQMQQRAAVTTEYKIEEPVAPSKAPKMDTCRKCKKSGYALNEFTSPYTGLCAECSLPPLDPVVIAPAMAEVFKEVFPASPVAAQEAASDFRGDVAPLRCQHDLRCQYLNGHKSPCKDWEGKWITVGFNAVPVADEPTAPPASQCSCSPGNGLCLNCWDKMPRCVRCGKHRSPGLSGYCEDCLTATAVSAAKKLTITFEISEAGAIAMFSDLSISQKAAALRAALEASWRV